MNRLSAVTRSRPGALAIVAALVFASAACSSSPATSGAISTSKKLSQQAYAVNSLESRPNDNLFAKVTVYSGQSLNDVVGNTASIVWKAMPVRIATLDVEAHGPGEQLGRHFTRAQLEQAYGARPAGLDRDATAVANEVATGVVKVGALLLAGIAGLGLLTALAMVALVRRRSSGEHSGSYPAKRP